MQSPKTFGVNFDARVDMLEHSEQDILPSYEAAVGALDNTKLPSYRRNFAARFHPYKRPILKNVDERERFLNTVLDDEYIPLNVPTARRRRPGSLQMANEAEETQRLRELESRVQRLDSTINVFIEGVRRAHIAQ